MTVTEPSSVEAYEDLPSAVSSALGAVTIPLRQIPLSTRAVFTVSIPGSAPLTAWTIAKGNPAQGNMQPIMSWAGPTPVGPFTVDGPDQLTLTGIGAAVSSAIQAVALGKRGPTLLVPPEVPLGPAQTIAVTGGPPTVLGTVNGGPGTYRVPPSPQTLPAGLRSVTLDRISNNPAPTITVTGVANLYYQGTPRSIGAACEPITFYVAPDETQLTIVLAAGSGNQAITVLGSFTNDTAALRPPVGMPASASQLSAQSVAPPGLDRALWVARADCPRLNADAGFTANGTLIAAPGAGKRLKLYNAHMTSAAAAANATLAGTINGGGTTIWRTNLPAAAGRDTNFDGLEMDANTALTVSWIAGNPFYQVAYDIVPA